MLRSPIKTTGPCTPARSRRIRRSWCRPQPGTNDRWVLATTIATERSVEPPDHHGPRLLVHDDHFARLVQVQREAGYGIRGSRSTCQESRGIAREQGDPVRRRTRDVVFRWRPSRSLPGCPERAAANRWVTAPIASAATAVRSARWERG